MGKVDFFWEVMVDFGSSFIIFTFSQSMLIKSFQGKNIKPKVLFVYLQPRSSDGFQVTSWSIYRGHTSSSENVMREAVKNLAEVKINNTLCVPFIH